jgi:hypothetical protein
VYVSGKEGAAIPVITTGKHTQPAPTSVELTTKTAAKRSTGDAWSDEWDEELVDATDLRTTQTAAVDQPVEEPKAAVPAQASKPSPFLSASNAIADDKAPAAASETKTAPVATASVAMDTTPATPAASAASGANDTAPAAAAPAEEVEKPVAAAPAKTEPAKLTPAVEPAAATTSVASTAPAVTTTQVATAKLYAVQLASYRSEAEATAGWQTLTTEQKDLLAKLPHAVAKADLGADKGVYYRLQAGAFSDRQAAKALCSDLQTRSIDCMVVEATTSVESAAPAKTQQSMVTPDSSFVIGAR